MLWRRLYTGRGRRFFSVYNAKFISNDGGIFVFGADGSNVFDIDGLSGMKMTLTKSQTYSRVGENVSSKATGGRTLTINGRIYNNISAVKGTMLRVFGAFTAGKLIFNDKYYIPAIVKDTPTVSPKKNDGAFMLRLFAPDPYFRDLKTQYVEFSSTTASFRFPFTLSEKTFVLGSVSPTMTANAYNDGDAPTAYTLAITALQTVTNPRLSCGNKYIAFAMTLEENDELIVWRDDDGSFHADLHQTGGDKVLDAVQYLDDGSTLFELGVGDNNLVVSNKEGVAMGVVVSFNSPFSGVYEA